MRQCFVWTAATAALWIGVGGCTSLVDARHSCSGRAAKLAGQDGALDREIYAHIFETCMEANGFPGESAPIDR